MIKVDDIWGKPWRISSGHKDGRRSGERERKKTRKRNKEGIERIRASVSGTGSCMDNAMGILEYKICFVKTTQRTLVCIPSLKDVSTLLVTLRKFLTKIPVLYV